MDAELLGDVSLVVLDRRWRAEPVVVDVDQLPRFSVRAFDPLDRSRDPLSQLRAAHGASHRRVRDGAHRAF
jgi:hypothetical protein